MITGNVAFCPNCGQSFPTPNTYPLTCSSCTAVWYHNSKPTSSILVIQDDQVLLAKRKDEPAKGEYDIPGGFLEYGELPEAGAIREAQEEMGVDIQIDRFFHFSSTDYAPHIKTLDCFFIAHITNGTPKPNDDVEELVWFPITDLPQLKLSLAGPKDVLNKLYTQWSNNPTAFK